MYKEGHSNSMFHSGANSDINTGNNTDNNTYANPRFMPTAPKWCSCKNITEQKEKDPGLLFIVVSDMTLPENINNQQLKKVYKEKIAKLVYTNIAFHRDKKKKKMNSGWEI